jgi:hypothetical protein
MCNDQPVINQFSHYRFNIKAGGISILPESVMFCDKIAIQFSMVEGTDVSA